MKGMFKDMTDDYDCGRMNKDMDLGKLNSCRFVINTIHYYGLNL